MGPVCSGLEGVCTEGCPGETLSPALPYRGGDTWEVQRQAFDDEHFNTLEEQKLAESCTGWDDTGRAAGWEASSQVPQTSRRMPVCNAARYHVSVCVPIYRWYVQGYI